MKKMLTLSKNDIHLWSTKPQALFEDESENESEHNNKKKSEHSLTNQLLIEQYKTILTPEELKRQQRYKFRKDQHNALVTRAFIRDLLSHYADVAPSDWRFVKGEKDKPEIENPPLPLRFNLSHTEGLIICAVTLDNDIGCDVEYIARNNDVLSIADRFFSPLESTALFSLPQKKQRDRFFDYWTLKESYIKAWGLGLAIPLKDFSFTIAPPIHSSDKMIDDIALSFAARRQDNANHWRSWLFYPNNTHRIALSLRGKTNIQANRYSFRFFESTPLLSMIEKETM